MITRLKHIHIIRRPNAQGQTVEYYYHRLTKVRIKGNPGTQEFLENYRKAASATEAAKESKGRTLSRLIIEYKSSDFFTVLSDKSKKDYNKHLERIDKDFGDTPLKVLEDKRIRKDLLKWRNKIGKDAPRQADYLWSVFRRVVQYGVHISELENNHLKNPGQLSYSDRSDFIWLPKDVDTYLSVAPPHVQAVIILALHTGQRKSDIIRLEWSQYDDDCILLKQGKQKRREKKRRTVIPVTATLRAFLEHLREQNTKNAKTILINSRGKPWTEDGFYTSFSKWRDLAELKHLTFHDLRGTAVTVLAEMGCTDIEIASITGHKLETVSEILGTYTSRTRKLAESAIRKLEESWIGQVGHKNEGKV